MRKNRKKGEIKKLNKTAILAAIALSISYGTGVNASSSSDLFNLKEVGSYSVRDILARCGSGSCGDTTSPRNVPPPFFQNFGTQVDDEENDENEPETFKECKKQCKEEYEKGTTEFKQCKKDCKNRFQ